MIEQKEKLIRPVSGLLFLIMGLLLYVVAIAVLVYASTLMWDSQVQVWTMAVILSLVYMILIGPMIFIGLKIVNPNEAVVLVLFGKYYGTISKDGFFWVNPFCRAFNPTAKITYSGKERIATANKKVSLKAMTLNNEKQKVNDLEGNPIEIGVIVIWKIVNSAKAVFNVDDYVLYISTQCDSAIRHVARKYPYDASEDGQEKSLRGSSQEVAEDLKNELQSRVNIAGIEIVEARISHLAYSQEIAAAMLQRQQASAIVAARQKIVEGAVGMVEMALTKLSENNIVELDDERKAAMVSNLLVVLCANKETQPIVNSGSIY
ncbi:MAG: SPFH domain-containing protein [Anaerovorax sp.]